MNLIENKFLFLSDVAFRYKKMAIEIHPKLVKGSEKGFYEEKEEEEQEKRPDFISANMTRPHPVWGFVLRFNILDKCP